MLWLGEEALTILRAMEAVRDPGSLWLFPSRESKAGHLTTLKTFGRLVTRRTGLDGVKIHDLRRTFTSKFLTNGVDVRTVMGVTGHTRVQTLAKYYAQAVPGKHREALKELFYTGT